MGFGALLVRRRSTSGHSVERCCSTSSSPGAASSAAARRRLYADRAATACVGSARLAASRCGAPTSWPVERCRECSGRRIAFATARAAVAYDDRARVLVAAWKERGLRKLAELAAELVCRGRPPPAVVHADLRPGRPQPPARAWAQPRRAPGERDRRPLGPPSRAPPVQETRRRSAAGSASRRAATQRARCVPGHRRRAPDARPRRRRLHDRRHGLGGGDRASQGRREAHRGRHLCASAFAEASLSDAAKSRRWLRQPGV